MIVDEAGERDLVALVVAKVGSVEETGDVWAPYRLSDQTGATVAAFLNELQASGRSAATRRSYAMDLLRWFRFLWAVEVPWVQATRVEARDFCRWLVLGLVQDGDVVGGRVPPRRRPQPADLHRQGLVEPLRGCMAARPRRAVGGLLASRPADHAGGLA
jgi:hypothetical protein